MATGVEPELNARRDAESDTTAPGLLDGAESGLTLEALLIRARRMFLDMSRSPVASGLEEPAAGWPEATLLLICLVDQARSQLWKDSEGAVRAACCPRLPEGLFCKVELFGYLLADVLGRPLLPADEALLVGQRGDNAVAKAKRILNVKKPEAMWRAAAGADSRLGSTYDLKLPQAAAGKKRPATYWADRESIAAQAKSAKADAAAAQAKESRRAAGAVQRGRES